MDFFPLQYFSFFVYFFWPFLDVLLSSVFELFARLLFDSYINRNNWSGFLFFAIPEVFKVLHFAHIKPSTSDNKQLLFAENNSADESLKKNRFFFFLRQVLNDRHDVYLNDLK